MENVFDFGRYEKISIAIFKTYVTTAGFMITLCTAF